MNELAVIQQPDAFPTSHELDVINQIATNVAESGFFSNVKTPAEAATLILSGRELGIGYLAAIRGIHIIQGKPSLSAELIHALIRRDHGGAALRIKETTDKLCTIQYRRREWPVGEYDSYTYTIDQAKQAGYLSNKNPNWHTIPANMLRARCISEVARIAYVDSLLGMFILDEGVPELEIVESNGDGKLAAYLVDGEASDPPVSEPDDDEYIVDLEAAYRGVYERMVNGTTIEQLRAAWEDAKRLGFAHDEEMVAVKDQRKAELEGAS